MRTTSYDIRLAPSPLFPKSWRLSPLWSKADGLDVLCPLDRSEFYLNGSVATLDALLRDHGGDRYLGIVQSGPA